MSGPLVEGGDPVAASEARSREVAERSADLLLQTDAEDRVLWVSQTTGVALGWPISTLVGQRLVDLVHPSDVADGGTAAAAEPAPVLYRVMTGAGEHRWLAGTATDVADDDGAATGRVIGLRVLDDVDHERDEEPLHVLAERASDVVMRVVDGITVWVSPSLRGALGWEPAEWVGQYFQNFIHPADLDTYRAERAVMRNGGSVTTTVRLLAKDAMFYPVELQGSPYVNAKGMADGVAMVWRTIDRLEISPAPHGAASAATGLVDREEAFEQLALIMQLQPRGGRRLGLAYCALDDAAALRAEHGAAAVDELLRVLVARIRVALRRDDVVTRISSDEVLVLLCGVRDLDTALRTADKIRSAVSVPVAVGGGEVLPTATIAVMLDAVAQGADELVTGARRGIDEARRSGRGQIVAVTPAD